LQALAQAHGARLCRRLRAAVAQIAEGEPVAVVAKHARVERSTVYRWIERILPNERHVRWLMANDPVAHA
jgi:transposase-like protein